MQNEYLLSSTDASIKDTIPIILDVTNDDTLNSNNNDNHLNICQNDQQSPKSSLSKTDASLCVKEYQLIDSSIKFQSNSEDVEVENEKVIKRELRRKKKRQATRVRKEKHDLEKQIRDLEFKQNNLLSKVENLQLYKEQLEIRCKQVHSNYKLFG
ncbi:unnamed protein product [Rotaria sordida]|uniref:BZIP domain-containing protein n=1 Tax=Rotaria sordida TaxID=392033 RepID=A0A815AD87_9BILA|nr:unnamed protein product [Rotaria sordida]